MKNLIILFTFIFSFNSYADVICSGNVAAVYAGMHGPGDYSYTLWVNIPDVGIMPLGRYNNDLAKIRFSMVQTALVTQKKITLKYYSHNTCESARAALAQPTYAEIS